MDPLDDQTLRWVLIRKNIVTQNRNAGVQYSSRNGLAWRQNF